MGGRLARKTKPILLLSTLAFAGATACVPLPSPTSVSVETSQPSGAATEPIGAEEVLTTLGASETGLDTSDAVECAEEAIRAAAPGTRIVPAEQFRDALFPWFEPATQPRSEDALATLLAKPLVADRIAQLGVRYVIAVGEPSTSEGEATGLHPILVGIPLPAGVMWSERKSTISATVWDLVQGTSAGTVEVVGSGTSYLLNWVFAFGVGIPATETRACHELGRRLAGLFTGQDTDTLPTARPAGSASTR